MILLQQIRIMFLIIPVIAFLMQLVLSYLKVFLQFSIIHSPYIIL